MALEIEYDINVESALKASERYARKGHLGRASIALTEAKRLWMYAYPHGSRTGGIHRLRIERSEDVLSVRKVVASLAPGDYLNPGRQWRLKMLAEDLADQALYMSDFLLDYLPTSGAHAHVMSEVGFTGVCQGRVSATALALSAEAHNKRSCADDTADAYNRAEDFVVGGSNCHYRALLFGHRARLLVMQGADRTPALKLAARATLESAVSDPGSFWPSLRDTVQLARDRNPELAEASIRNGNI